jgi:hypothetical protein
MQLRIACVTAVLLASAGLARGEDNGPKTAEVRKAVERALPFLAQKGDAWVARRATCNSCHSITFTIWGHEAARRRGFAVDPKELHEWTDWAAANSLRDHWFTASEANLQKLRNHGAPESVLSKLKPMASHPWGRDQYLLDWMKRQFTPQELEQVQAKVFQDLRDPIVEDGLSLSQMILAFDGTSDPRSAELVQKLRARLLDGQGPEGYWGHAGQSEDLPRPLKETDQAATLWALIAQATDKHPSAAVLKSRERALAWLGDSDPGASTELLLLQMLREHQFGKPELARKWLQVLLAEQLADGGWGWVRSRKKSDPLTTGMVLYALASMGKGADDPAVQRAQSYLLANQKEDGSWFEPGTGIYDKIYAHWGTGWATIGLLHTLPVPAKDGAGKAKE